MKRIYIKPSATVYAVNIDLSIMNPSVETDLGTGTGGSAQEGGITGGDSKKGMWDWQED